MTERLGRDIGAYTTLDIVSDTKICVACKSTFTPSSNHRKCPKCRASEGKKPCPTCGKLMDRKSKSCWECTEPDLRNWKGGKTTHKQGYPMILCQNHPRTSSKNKYVFEHILVMEEFLGRLLKSGENVHHKNGVKDDNRIENLELWIKPQPTGIRSTDAVKWAIEILELYAPKLLLK